MIKSITVGPETGALTLLTGDAHRQRLTLIDADTARFESTGNVGRANERTTTLTLRRGAHDDGCLRRIIPAATPGG